MVACALHRQCQLLGTTRSNWGTLGADTADSATSVSIHWISLGCGDYHKSLCKIFQLLKFQWTDLLLARILSHTVVVYVIQSYTQYNQVIEINPVQCWAMRSVCCKAM